MSITSAGFPLLAAGLTIIYFRIPRKWQWALLLAASLGFYACSGLRGGSCLLLTAASVYGAALLMEAMAVRHRSYLKEHKAELTKEEKSALRKKNTARRRWVLAGALVLNFSLLCVFKYAHFALAQLNRLAAAFGGGPAIPDTLTLLMPLGISFYTFQSTGYLIDVYWEKTEAQRNFGKLLLFVSFFPQIIQGPISSYGQLSAELFTPHDFSFDRLGRGLRRMLWGYFKKLVVADILADFVLAVFAGYADYSGTAVFLGILFYCVQIYADFSGYMDIVCGLCHIWGVTLRENFNRPYFSKSVAEYWRRWHISLGDWFKAYLYYPIAVSGWAKRLGKWGQKRLGAVGKTLPATAALVLVWLTTGLWHGASWAYIGWGGVNGFFIIVSLWLEPVYQRVNAKLSLTDGNRAWQIFRILRTFLLVAFIKALPEAGTLAQGLGLWKRVFTGGIDLSWAGLFPYGAGKAKILVILFGTVLMLLADLIKGKEPLDEFLDKKPIPARFAFYYVLICVILIFGCYGAGYTARDFLYFKY